MHKDKRRALQFDSDEVLVSTLMQQLMIGRDLVAEKSVIGAAVGAAVGGASGLSGAAATSAGLAVLGGGSIAAGGFGTAGGTALLTGIGAVGGGGAAAIGSLATRWTAAQVVVEAIKLDVVTRLVILDAEGDDELARRVVEGLQARLDHVTTTIGRLTERLPFSASIRTRPRS